MLNIVGCVLFVILLALLALALALALALVTKKKTDGPIVLDWPIVSKVGRDYGAGADGRGAWRDGARCQAAHWRRQMVPQGDER